MFKRLFNWIKFKVLPPSINFKNRLFLERDSKSRRITNNLGLTFRNSKWADYTRTDINLNLGYSYKQTFLLTTLLLTFLSCLFYFIKFYNFFLLSNDIIFLYWSLKDLFFYYFFTFLTICSSLLTATLEKLYINFIGWFFLQIPVAKIPSTKPKAVYPKSQDLKYVLYAWFKGSNSSLTSLSLESLTKPDKTKSLLDGTSYNFKKLFLASHFLSVNVDSSNSSLSKNLKYAELKFHLSKQSLTEIKSPKLTYSSPQFLDKQNTWGFPTTIKNSSGVPTHARAFVLNLLSYSRYQELSKNISPSLAFEEALKTQLSLIKSNRFLYNYSFLHRKLLKNTHKLTTIKKLLGVSWYDSKLTFKNIWASDLFAELGNPQSFLQSGLGLSYGTLFNDKVNQSYLKGGSSYDRSSNTYLNLVHYESSFFWLAKRIYNLNTLNATTNNLTFFIKRVGNFLPPVKQPQHLTLISQSEVLTNSPFFVNLLSESTPTTSITPRGLGVPKDSFTSFWENDLLLSEDENLIVEFTNSPIQNINLLPLFVRSADSYQNTNSWDLRPLTAANLNPNLLVYSGSTLVSYTKELTLFLALITK